MKKGLYIFFILLSAISILIAIGSIALADYDPDGPIVVSIGDSYSAGEGIPPFYGQGKNIRDKVHDYDWLAHRSQFSWHGMLQFPSLSGTLSEHRGSYFMIFGKAKLMPGNWYFAAASGAETKHLLHKQEKEYRQTDPYGKEILGFKVSETYEDTEYLPPQIDVFTALKQNGKQADYVILTMGGNDMGFANVMMYFYLDMVLAGNDFTTPQLRTLDSRFKDEVREKIKWFYIDVWNATDAKATIIVVGYPRLFAENSKYVGQDLRKSAFEDRAHRVNVKVTWFNEQLKEIVEECAAENPGMDIYFVDVEQEFYGHEAYSSENIEDEYINRFILPPQPQDLKYPSTVNEGIEKLVSSLISFPPSLEFTDIASAYSIHPNINGARAYARCVQKFIDSPEFKNGKNKTTTYTEETILFGHYEQDSDFSNGKEPIEWIVVGKKTNGDLLLMSKYALDAVPYNVSNTDTTWENCSLRQWLNNDFYNAAFSDEDKSRIVTITLENADNPEFGTAGGNDTQDRVWIPSFNDVYSYYLYSDRGVCIPTKYAVSNNAYITPKDEYHPDSKESCCWWLRTLGASHTQACIITDVGDIDSYGMFIARLYYGVRPMIVINLDGEAPSEDENYQVGDTLYAAYSLLSVDSMPGYQGDCVDQLEEKEAVIVVRVEWLIEESTDELVPWLLVRTQRAQGWVCGWDLVWDPDDAGDYFGPYDDYEYDPFEALENCDIGDLVSFGTYKQYDDPINEEEPIDWLVLDKRGDGTIVLISNDILDAKPYHSEYKSVSWDNCDLRKWLNGEFYEAVFTDEEKAHIVTSSTICESSGLFGIKTQTEVEDKVFILSMDEAEHFFADDDARISYATEYATSRGIYTHSNHSGDWWLRDTMNKSVATVNTWGEIGRTGGEVNFGNIGIRPVVTVVP